MNAKLSALMDDALDEQDASDVLQEMARDPDLVGNWELYHMIGDCLRQVDCAPVSGNFTARCMAALESEPTVLAPRPAVRRSSQVLRLALPFAASVMGVGAVAWVAQVVLPPRAGAQVVAMAPATQATMSSIAMARTSGIPAPRVAYAGAPVRVQPVSQMRDYVVAHEGYSPWVAVQGAARYQAGMADARQDGAQ